MDIDFRCNLCGLSGSVGFNGNTNGLLPNVVVEIVAKYHHQNRPTCISKLAIDIPDEILLNDDPKREYWYDPLERRN